MERFEPSSFLPARVISLLTEVRVSDPDRVLRAAERRARRSSLTTDGRLNIVAADHPGRRVTRVGQDPLAMADRHGYLARVARVLLSESVDGVMATMDVIEDLLILDDLLRERGETPLLDGKLLIASLNRGGLAGAAWELDDPISGASPADCAARKLDGAKLLLRLCDEEPASLRTLVTASQAIRELNALSLPAFLEALPVMKAPSGYRVCREASELARIAGVASALGDSSRRLWLKLPYCDGFAAVARATTLPVLILGGEATGQPTRLLHEIAAGMAAGANVRGAMAGRNVLYPGERDPLAVADAVGGLVHVGCTMDEAEAIWSRPDYRNMDAISSAFV